ncbi:MAG: hypothetical protein IJC25_02095 [Clostridia bacterium]|nr:hypothetical protein [Clostridia bacterium]
MLKLIIGEKGTGKTKVLIDLVNAAAQTSNGNVVCIEKGMKMTYDISHSAKLIDIEEYNIKGYGELFGYLSGLCAGNYDITDIFVDGLFKICDRDYAAADDFFDRVAKLAESSKANFTFTVSADMKDLPADLQRYV